MTGHEDQPWELALYINGASAHSLKAIDAVRHLCDHDLAGQVTLEVVDVQDRPGVPPGDRILATPTLVRRYPEPVRQIVGGDFDVERIRQGFALPPFKMPAGDAEP